MLECPAPQAPDPPGLRQDPPVSFFEIDRWRLAHQGVITVAVERPLVAAAEISIISQCIIHGPLSGTGAGQGRTADTPGIFAQDLAAEP